MTDSSESTESTERFSPPRRLIVMGTGPFAVPSFEALRAAGHEIALVVTKPQPPVKSRQARPLAGPIMGGGTWTTDLRSAKHQRARGGRQDEG